MVERLDFPETLLEFQRMFPDEEHCAAYLEAIRWPDGFVCRSCGWKGEPYRFANRPTVLRCRSCQQDTSLTVDTVMHGTKIPLQIWFWAAHMMATQTPGVSAVQFKRQFGLREETAFQLLHKLRAGTVRPDQDQIGGQWPVEVDETFVGGKTKGEGRGVHHKAIVAGAVELRPRQRKKKGRRNFYAGRLRLRLIPDRSKRTLEAFMIENVLPGTTVTTDGHEGYENLAKLGYDHEFLPTLGDPAAIEAALPMIHIVFSNLKTWLLGTHHGVSQKHLQAYLNEYVFRFNRRFYPMVSFNSVLGIGTIVEGPTHEGLYSGEWEHPNPEEL